MISELISSIDVSHMIVFILGGVFTSLLTIIALAVVFSNDMDGCVK